MIVRIWNSFKHIHYAWHIIFSVIIRAIFIVYGIYHDRTSIVQYTDVDYKVFTDASRHVLNNKSPYDRHTYRYSPLVAYLLIPNVTLDFVFGKILFCLSDLLVGLLIRIIVIHMLKEYDTYKQKTELNHDKLKVEYNNTSNLKNIRNRKKGRNVIKNNGKFQILKTENDLQADIAMIVWLYNPLSIAISTRGNCDSIAGLLVLLTLYFLQCRKQYFLSGIIHGISVHYRLYPIIYSLAMYMYLSKYSYYTTNRFKIYYSEENTIGRKVKEIKYIENKISEQTSNSDMQDIKRKTIFQKKYLAYLVPNLDQLRLVSGCLFSLITITYFFYHIYGYKFLYETYIYHLVRKDTRHNFSVFFYLQYLTAGVKNIGLWQKVLIVLPQVILLLLFSMRYGLNKFSFNFSILVLTITMVTYNTVLTSQYFVWILVVLPLCIWQIKISVKMALGLLCIWFAAQAAWLMPAYFLEFRGQNSFLFIWLQSVSFFCANIAILGRMIMNFMPLKKHKA